MATGEPEGSSRARRRAGWAVAREHLLAGLLARDLTRRSRRAQPPRRMLPRIERFVRTERQETAPVGDGAVVMQVDTGVSYSLNAVGAWVWEQLATPAGVDQLCEGLTDRYEVTEERARKDLEALLADLQRTELVSRAP